MLRRTAATRAGRGRERAQGGEARARGRLSARDVVGTKPGPNRPAAADIEEENLFNFVMNKQFC